MTFSLWQSKVSARTTLCIALLAALPSCGSVALHQGNSLRSYADMSASGGSMTKAKLRVDSPQLLAARTVRIEPTATQIGNNSAFDPKSLTLVANAIDRALCTGLSDRFQIVAANQPADLVVHATITDIVPTNRTVAATSAMTSLGTSVALAVPIPRIPIGLGGLSVEAEAIGQDGSQKAAMLWSRGANMLTTKARVSAVGDAYSLSSSFGGDFSRMLVRGRDPFKGISAMPSMQKIKASLGGGPKYEACKAFGKAPGITGVVAGQLGLPPGWSDRGAATSP
jgi:hypothetical protein